MALTRRFFTKLAADFNGIRPRSEDPAHDTWTDCVIVTATALAEQNAMFNYAKFYQACGMPQEAVERVAVRR
jgi:hypothetical protein